MARGAKDPTGKRTATGGSREKSTSREAVKFHENFTGKASTGGAARRKGSRSGPGGHSVQAVSRALQAKLIEIAGKIGLFSQQGPFDSDSRFAHPVVLPQTTPIPAGMAEIFRKELAALQRLGKSVECSHRVEFPPYRVHCISYFHYDGFQALMYVEKKDSLVAAWKEEEVEQLNSPRELISADDPRHLEDFLRRCL